MRPLADLTGGVERQADDDDLGVPFGGQIVNCLGTVRILQADQGWQGGDDRPGEVGGGKSGTTVAKIDSQNPFRRLGSTHGLQQVLSARALQVLDHFFDVFTAIPRHDQ